jgi:hypothetical protein
MQDGSWSWSTWGEENFPATTGKPHYLSDSQTCVLPVKLEPGKFYAVWLNSEKFKNFKDASGRPAVPYLLTFSTSGTRSSEGAAKPVDPGVVGKAAPEFVSKLKEDQRAVLNWTDRQFRSFFDRRTFDGWSESERAELEKKMIDTLNGPITREYYQAINTLAALRSRSAIPKLREIAYERRDKENRDRWMSIRALGLISDAGEVPELIHLVYHGNVNTRWWAQIALVSLTGQNFGSDWKAWGKWWNEQKGEPPFNFEVVRWWPGQAEPEKLAESLEESDRKFLEGLKPGS